MLVLRRLRPLPLITVLALTGACTLDSPGASEGDTETGGSSASGGSSGETGETTGVDAGCPVANFLDVSQGPGAGDAYAAPELSVHCTDDALIIESNGIPTYTFVPITPNPLVVNDLYYELPRHPAVADAPTDIPLLGTLGVGVNGLPLFGPNEAAVPADSAYGDPIYNSITDECLGHTANVYHYHALVEKCMTKAGLVAEPWSLPDPDPSTPSPVIGYGYDGFPIYGARECKDESCAEILTLESSWVMIGDPHTNAWDAYQYQEQAGPQFLDRCNGHVGPGGDYHYHATDTFPYILGCYTGTPAVGGSGIGGEQPPMCQMGQTTMCCGDGTCEGPETAMNCPADC
ncbi:MAG: YHYH protein [Nannocystaceae bacterium]